MQLLVKRLGHVNVHPYYVYMHDMVKGVEELRTTIATALDTEKFVRGSTAGFNTPTFVCDAPGGGGKRDVHSFEYYDRENGIAVYAAPSVKPGKAFVYFDPVDRPEPGGSRALGIAEDARRDDPRGHSQGRRRRRTARPRVNDKGFRLDFAIAIGALFISTVTALASVYQSRVIAQQFSAAVWPYFSFDVNELTDVGRARPPQRRHGPGDRALGGDLLGSASPWRPSKPIVDKVTGEAQKAHRSRHHATATFETSTPSVGLVIPANGQRPVIHVDGPDVRDEVPPADSTASTCRSATVRSPERAGRRASRTAPASRKTSPPVRTPSSPELEDSGTAPAGRSVTSGAMRIGASEASAKRKRVRSVPSTIAISLRAKSSPMQRRAPPPKGT